jgi:hypothetical protein
MLASGMAALLRTDRLTEIAGASNCNRDAPTGSNDDTLKVPQAPF